MALFVSSLGQISGKIGGLVFSRGRSGDIIRTRRIPVNVRSNRQELVRAILGNAAGQWSSLLSSAQRQAWIDYADATPLVNSLGVTYFMSGLNAYVRTNAFLRNVTGTPLTAAPIVGGQSDAPSPEGVAPIVVTDSASAQPNSVLLNYPSLVWDGRSTDDAWIAVYISRILNPGVAFFSTPFAFQGSDEGNTADPLTQSIIPTDLVLSVGQRVSVQLRAIDADGRVSPFEQDSGLVVNIP